MILLIVQAPTVTENQRPFGLLLARPVAKRRQVVHPQLDLQPALILLLNSCKSARALQHVHDEYLIHSCHIGLDVPKLMMMAQVRGPARKGSSGSPSKKK